MSQTGRLPDQLRRWHTKWARGSFPCIVEGSKKRNEMTVIQVWYRHVTGYWEKKLPHLPGANSQQFWNIINGN